MTHRQRMLKCRIDERRAGRPVVRRRGPRVVPVPDVHPVPVESWFRRLLSLIPFFAFLKGFVR
jgi:hypothetical protein